jgi:hypothetical protein
MIFKNLPLVTISPAPLSQRTPPHKPLLYPMKQSLAGFCSSFLVASSVLALSAHAAVVFQADFNGTGSSTGGVSDMVTLGGTGVINNPRIDQSLITVSNPLTSPLGAGTGAYLHFDDTGTQTASRFAGVTFTPTNKDSSFDSWYGNTSGTVGYDTLNGGFDFLFRTSSNANLGGNTLRLLDLNGGAAGYRLVLTSSATDKLQLQLLQNGTILATADSGHDSVNLSANITYRIGATVTTDNSGKVTLKLFKASGDTSIDTSSADHLIASSTTTSALDGNDSISSSFNSAAGFNFGLQSNSDDDIKTVDLDSFRIYDSAPTTFSSIPEPGTFSLVMGSLIGAGVCLQRRR